jgi:hypothetical protein
LVFLRELPTHDSLIVSKSSVSEGDLPVSREMHKSVLKWAKTDLRGG